MNNQLIKNIENNLEHLRSSRFSLSAEISNRPKKTRADQRCPIIFPLYIALLRSLL